jgi:O-antigen/teichoic acid export membrane protein
MEVSGLFSRDKYASIIGSAVNLVTSIVLGLRIGMAGIFIGTCLTYAIQFAMKAYFLYRLKWNRSPMRYCLTFAGRTALLVALMLAARAVTDRLPVTGDLPAFLINGCLTAGAAAAVLIGTSAGTPEFAYAKELIIKRLRG